MSIVRVIKLVLEYPFHFESVIFESFESVIFAGVIPTGAQRSGGIRCSTGTVDFGREAGFSAPPLTL
jgi:hypothetical protein